MWTQQIDEDQLAAGDVCERAKGTHNLAKLIWLAFSMLTLLLATACVFAAIYTFVEFRDQTTARGWIALIGAVAALGGTIGLGTLIAGAREQERYHFNRMNRVCSPPPG